MIPYFSQPHLSLGPISIHLFGVLVAIGILTALRLMRWRAGRLGLDAATAERLGVSAVLGGFVMAHIFDRVAYFPRETLADPLSLLRFWESISSFGGFLGGVLASFWFVRGQRDRWAYLDLIGYALPVGWFFGRLGCFVAYDHPGITTTFFLAQRYKDGLVRHNLGLEEALYVLPVALLVLWLGRGGARRPGFFAGLIAVAYAPVRFLLDTLRTDDARYFHLTPGQYSAILLLVVGLKLLLWPPKALPAEQGQGLDVGRVGQHVEGRDGGAGQAQTGQ
jgi:phosphatidylglycerol:prolipoprotein diacylglycerol transferase